MNIFKRILIVFALVLVVGESYSQRVTITGGYGYGYGGNPYGGGMYSNYGFYSPSWYYPPGFGVGTIGVAAVVVDFSETKRDPDLGKVYYDKGLFYEKTETGYVVIPAPPGAKIPNVPEGYTLITRGSEDFYYVAGTFYALNSEGTYEVVAAPIGAKIPYLPKEGVTEEEYDQSTYYVMNGVHYLPIRSGTNVMYKIMPNPGTNADDPSNQLKTPTNKYPDYEQLTYLGVDYYYLKGKFYVLQPNGGKLIEVYAPVGISVSSIPEQDSEKITAKDGSLYLKFGATYFQAKVVSGKYSYVVTEAPKI